MAKKYMSFGMALLLLLIICCSFPVSAESYKSYTYDANGEEVPAPVAYSTARVYRGEVYDGKALNAPEDVFVAGDEKIYICDTGNNRIVILNGDYSLNRTVETFNGTDGEPLTFNKPKGIFVTDKGDIYLCDTGNSRILIADSDFTQKGEPLIRPNSSLISQEHKYSPAKITVDTVGNVYVVATGIYQGLVSYNTEGEFTGFFGSNPVELSIAQTMLLFWKEIFSKEQEEVMEQFIPVEFTNLHIDANNCIYTVTQQTESSTDEIKKLNAKGNNVLRYEQSNTLYPVNDFGDHGTTIENSQSIDSRFEDVHVDEDGVISGLDTRRGRVFQYDQDGNLLFVFGGIEQQKGMFSEPTAVDKVGENYIVLDRVNCSLTVFEPTNYAKTVREALIHYNQGDYATAQTLWQEVLAVSNYSTLAYRGIGRSLLQQQEYHEALEYLKKAEDRVGYSEAFSEVRKDILRDNLLFIVIGLTVGIIVITKLLRYLLLRWGVIEPKKKRGVKI